jgi:site-specific recombinase XerD
VKLADGIEQYVVRKHAEGIEFAKGESYLTGLLDSVGDIDIDEVKTQQVLAFLNGSMTRAATWRLKYFVLRHFFDSWTAYGATPEILMPPIRPKEQQNFLPYVYSRAELSALLKATAWNYKAKISVARFTMRVLIILLYGTGARIGEILSLAVDDIDVERSTIQITNKNPNRCRQIPIGMDLREVLRRYLVWRAKKKPSSPQLFLTKSNKPLSSRIADKNFHMLRKIAKVTREAQSVYQPRLNDLQCTFAVHRITSWIRSGTDLDLMLPALAAYMGLVGLSSTERYLHMTPARFKKQLNKLSPYSRKRYWRNDKELIEFLAGL